MALKLITPPSAEPISLVEAKQYCRIDHSDEDELINRYITEARLKLDGRDGVLWRALVTQTWELYLDKFPANEIEIPFPPLQSVTSVIYIDADGNEQTVNSADYTVDIISQPGWIIPVTGTSWPNPMDVVNAVKIRFVAGYGNAVDVPAALRNWIGDAVAWRYDNRGALKVSWPDFGPVMSYRVKWFA